MSTRLTFIPMLPPFTITIASAFHGTESVVWHSVGPSGTCPKASKKIFSPFACPRDSRRRLRAPHGALTLFASTSTKPPLCRQEKEDDSTNRLLQREAIMALQKTSPETIDVQTPSVFFFFFFFLCFFVFFSTTVVAVAVFVFFFFYYYYYVGRIDQLSSELNFLCENSSGSVIFQS